MASRSSSVILPFYPSFSALSDSSSFVGVSSTEHFQHLCRSSVSSCDQDVLSSTVLAVIDRCHSLGPTPGTCGSSRGSRGQSPLRTRSRNFSLPSTAESGRVIDEDCGAVTCSPLQSTENLTSISCGGGGIVVREGVQKSIRVRDALLKVQLMVEGEKQRRLSKSSVDAANIVAPLPPRVLVFAVDTSMYSRDAVLWARKNGQINNGDIVTIVSVCNEATTPNRELSMDCDRHHHSLHTPGTFTPTEGEAYFSGDVDDLRDGSDLPSTSESEDRYTVCRRMIHRFYGSYLSDCETFVLLISSHCLGKRDIAEVISHTAESVGAYAIIVGCHSTLTKNQTAERFNLGSVARNVVDIAKCAVVVIKL